MSSSSTFRNNNRNSGDGHDSDNDSNHTATKNNKKNKPSQKIHQGSSGLLARYRNKSSGNVQKRENNKVQYDDASIPLMTTPSYDFIRDNAPTPQEEQQRRRKRYYSSDKNSITTNNNISMNNSRRTTMTTTPPPSNQQNNNNNNHINTSSSNVNVRKNLRAMSQTPQPKKNSVIDKNHVNSFSLVPSAHKTSEIKSISLACNSPYHYLVCENCAKEKNEHDTKQRIRFVDRHTESRKKLWSQEASEFYSLWEEFCAGNRNIQKHLMMMDVENDTSNGNLTRRSPPRQLQLTAASPQQSIFDNNKNNKHNRQLVPVGNSYYYSSSSPPAHHNHSSIQQQNRTLQNNISSSSAMMESHHHVPLTASSSATRRKISSRASVYGLELQKDDYDEEAQEIEQLRQLDQDRINEEERVRQLLQHIHEEIDILQQREKSLRRRIQTESEIKYDVCIARMKIVLNLDFEREWNIERVETQHEKLQDEEDIRKEKEAEEQYEKFLRQCEFIFSSETRLRLQIEDKGASIFSSFEQAHASNWYELSEQNSNSKRVVALMNAHLKRIAEDIQGVFREEQANRERSIMAAERAYWESSFVVAEPLARQKSKSLQNDRERKEANARTDVCDKETDDRLRIFTENLDDWLKMEEIALADFNKAKNAQYRRELKLKRREWRKNVMEKKESDIMFDQDNRLWQKRKDDLENKAMNRDTIIREEENCRENDIVRAFRKGLAKLILNDWDFDQLLVFEQIKRHQLEQDYFDDAMMAATTSNDVNSSSTSSIVSSISLHLLLELSHIHSSLFFLETAARNHMISMADSILFGSTEAAEVVYSDDDENDENNGEKNGNNNNSQNTMAASSNSLRGIIPPIQFSDRSTICLLLSSSSSSSVNTTNNNNSSSPSQKFPLPTLHSLQLLLPTSSASSSSSSTLIEETLFVHSSGLSTVSLANEKLTKEVLLMTTQAKTTDTTAADDSSLQIQIVGPDQNNNNTEVSPGSSARSSASSLQATTRKSGTTNNHSVLELPREEDVVVLAKNSEVKIKLIAPPFFVNNKDKQPGDERLFSFHLVHQQSHYSSSSLSKASFNSPVTDGYFGKNYDKNAKSTEAIEICIPVEKNIKETEENSSAVLLNEILKTVAISARWTSDALSHLKTSSSSVDASSVASSLLPFCVPIQVTFQRHVAKLSDRAASKKERKLILVNFLNYSSSTSTSSLVGSSSIEPSPLLEQGTLSSQSMFTRLPLKNAFPSLFGSCHTFLRPKYFVRVTATMVPPFSWLSASAVFGNSNENREMTPQEAKTQLFGDQTLSIDFASVGFVPVSASSSSTSSTTTSKSGPNTTSSSKQQKSSVTAASLSGGTFISHPLLPEIQQVAYIEKKEKAAATSSHPSSIMSSSPPLTLSKTISFLISNDLILLVFGGLNSSYFDSTTSKKPATIITSTKTAAEDQLRQNAFTVLSKLLSIVKVEKSFTNSGTSFIKSQIGTSQSYFNISNHVSATITGEFANPAESSNSTSSSSAMAKSNRNRSTSFAVNNNNKSSNNLSSAKTSSNATNITKAQQWTVRYPFGNDKQLQDSFSLPLPNLHPLYPVFSMFFGPRGSFLASPFAGMITNNSNKKLSSSSVNSIINSASTWRFRLLKTLAPGVSQQLQSSSTTVDSSSSSLTSASADLLPTINVRSQGMAPSNSEYAKCLPAATTRIFKQHPFFVESLHPVTFGGWLDLRLNQHEHGTLVFDIASSSSFVDEDASSRLFDVVPNESKEILLKKERETVHRFETEKLTSSNNDEEEVQKYAIFALNGRNLLEDEFMINNKEETHHHQHKLQIATLTLHAKSTETKTATMPSTTTSSSDDHQATVAEATATTTTVALPPTASVSFSQQKLSIDFSPTKAVPTVWITQILVSLIRVREAVPFRTDAPVEGKSGKSSSKSSSKTTTKSSSNASPAAAALPPSLAALKIPYNTARLDFSGDLSLCPQPRIKSLLTKTVPSTTPPLASIKIQLLPPLLVLSGGAVQSWLEKGGPKTIPSLNTNTIKDVSNFSSDAKLSITIIEDDVEDEDDLDISGGEKLEVPSSFKSAVARLARERKEKMMNPNDNNNSNEDNNNNEASLEGTVASLKGTSLLMASSGVGIPQFFSQNYRGKCAGWWQGKWKLSSSNINKNLQNEETATSQQQQENENNLHKLTVFLNDSKHLASSTASATAGATSSSANKKVAATAASSSKPSSSSKQPQSSSSTTTITSHLQLGAPAAAIQVLLRSITYQHKGNNPLKLSKKVLISLSDGINAGVSSLIVEFKIVPIDDPTEVILSTSKLLYLAGNCGLSSVGVQLFPRITLEDPDSDNFDGGYATVSICLPTNSSATKNSNNNNNASSSSKPSDIEIRGDRLGFLSPHEQESLVINRNKRKLAKSHLQLLLDWQNDSEDLSYYGDATSSSSTLLSSTRPVIKMVPEPSLFMNAGKGAVVSSNTQNNQHGINNFAASTAFFEASQNCFDLDGNNNNNHSHNQSFMLREDPSSPLHTLRAASLASVASFRMQQSLKRIRKNNNSEKKIDEEENNSNKNEPAVSSSPEKTEIINSNNNKNDSAAEDLLSLVDQKSPDFYPLLKNLAFITSEENKHQTLPLLETDSFFRLFFQGNCIGRATITDLSDTGSTASSGSSTININNNNSTSSSGQHHFQLRIDFSCPETRFVSFEAVEHVLQCICFYSEIPSSIKSQQSREVKLTLSCGTANPSEKSVTVDVVPGMLRHLEREPVSFTSVDHDSASNVTPWTLETTNTAQPHKIFPDAASEKKVPLSITSAAGVAACWVAIRVVPPHYCQNASLGFAPFVGPVENVGIFPDSNVKWKENNTALYWGQQSKQPIALRNPDKEKFLMYSFDSQMMFGSLLSSSNDAMKRSLQEYFQPMPMDPVGNHTNCAVFSLQNISKSTPINQVMSSLRTLVSNLSYAAHDTTTCSGLHRLQIIAGTSDTQTTNKSGESILASQIVDVDVKTSSFATSSPIPLIRAVWGVTDANIRVAFNKNNSAHHHPLLLSSSTIQENLLHQIYSSSPNTMKKNSMWDNKKAITPGSRIRIVVAPILREPVSDETDKEELAAEKEKQEKKQQLDATQEEKGNTATEDDPSPTAAAATILESSVKIARRSIPTIHSLVPSLATGQLASIGSSIVIGLKNINTSIFVEPHEKIPGALSFSFSTASSSKEFQANRIGYLYGLNPIDVDLFFGATTVTTTTTTTTIFIPSISGNILIVFEKSASVRDLQILIDSLVFINACDGDESIFEKRGFISVPVSGEIVIARNDGVAPVSTTAATSFAKSTIKSANAALKNNNNDKDGGADGGEQYQTLLNMTPHYVTALPKKTITLLPPLMNIEGFSPEGFECNLQEFVPKPLATTTTTTNNKNADANDDENGDDNIADDNDEPPSFLLYQSQTNLFAENPFFVRASETHPVTIELSLSKFKSNGKKLLPGGGGQQQEMASTLSLRASDSHVSLDGAGASTTEISSIAAPSSSANTKVEFKRWSKISDIQKTLQQQHATLQQQHQQKKAKNNNDSDNSPPQFQLGLVVDCSSTISSATEVKLVRESMTTSSNMSKSFSSNSQAATEVSIIKTAGAQGTVVAEITENKQSGDKLTIKLMPMLRKLCGRACVSLMKSIFVCSTLTITSSVDEPQLAFGGQVFDLNVKTSCQGLYCSLETVCSSENKEGSGDEEWTTKVMCHLG